MKRRNFISMLLAAALLSLIPVGCGKELNIDPPAPVPGGGGGDTPKPDPERPTEADRPNADSRIIRGLR